MLYRKLGSTNMDVSVIGFGCWQLGGELAIGGQPLSYGKIDESEAKEAVSLALKMGINFFDTADFYGLGKSESVLGDILREVRNNVIISTKAGLVPGGAKGSTTNGSYEHIISSCSKSLKRLKTDYIDVYLLHFIPPEDQIKESIKALKELKKEGKIREFGISVGHNISRIPEVIDKFPVIEGYYNLLLRDFEKFESLIKEKNIGFITASPLSRGLLSGKDYSNADLDKSDVRNKWRKGESQHDWYQQQQDNLLKLKELSGKWDMPLKQLSLAYILSHSISTIIPGMRSRQQVIELTDSLKLVPLDKEKLDLLTNSSGG